MSSMVCSNKKRHGLMAREIVLGDKKGFFIFIKKVNEKHNSQYWIFLSISPLPLCEKIAKSILFYVEKKKKWRGIQVSKNSTCHANSEKYYILSWKNKSHFQKSNREYIK